MTVRDLIKILEKIDGDKMVIMTDPDGIGWTNVGDIVYAVTNEKGKNRSERANDKYYAGIVATPGAVFVKLCDRIANVQYGKMTGSGMYDKYKKENANFVTKLGGDDKNHELTPMFEYLLNLFKD